MDTQYRKNLKAVLTASKDYTDNSIEKLKWELGTYDLSVETINGTTMLLPTPANTIQATMVRIDGKSEVSENLIVLNDIAETTNNGITYKIENGVITLNGTATANININLILNSTVYPTGIFATFNSQANSNVSIYNLKSNGAWGSIGFGLSTVNRTYTINDNTDLYGFRLYIKADTEVSNFVIKPFYIKGSTAPTEFKVGFEGIRNLELSGLKVEGQNLMNVVDNSSTSGGVSVVSSGGITTINGTTTASINKVISLLDLDLPAGTYTLSTLNTTFNWNNIGGVYIGNGEWNSVASVEGSTGYKTFTLTETTHIDRVRFYANNGTTFNNVVLKIMLVRGSTVPTEYQPYIAPTTKTIDLSTILYNGSPLFEGNSLKGVGTAKDYITPYVAHKGVGSRAYQSGDEEDTSVLTDGTTTLYPLTTPIEADIDFSQLVKFEAYSNGSTTLVNTNNQDTTSTFKYLKEVAK